MNLTLSASQGRRNSKRKNSEKHLINQVVKLETGKDRKGCSVPKMDAVAVPGWAYCLPPEHLVCIKYCVCLMNGSFSYDILRELRQTRSHG